jgi:DNA polymerase-3 subunit alpha
LSDYLKYLHWTAHFKTYEAYKTGVRLLSRAPVEQHGSEAKPLFNWAMLEELGGSGITLGSGCLIGLTARHILEYQDPVMAEKYYQRARSLVSPGDFYVEVMPHDCSKNHVSGAFLTLQEEGGEPFELRFYAGKTLKTNRSEIKAVDLAREFNQVGNEHTTLIGIKNRHTWEERQPAQIIKVHYDEGSFIQNECGPWAPDGDVQQGVNQFMLKLAAKYGDPVVCSGDSHFSRKHEKIIQDVRLAQSGSWRMYGTYDRKSSQDAFNFFQRTLGTTEKEFEGWVETSYEWAEKFKNFKMETKPSIPKSFYESKYAEVGAKDSLSYTMKLVRDHGRMRWDNPVWVARLKQEIELLHRNEVVDLLPYFMVFEELCRLYRNNNKLTGPGRGSASGLLLSYLLGITHVDPIKYGLSVDRFLTKTRIESGAYPDIDQDLGSRLLLVGEDGNSGWLRERFGDHVAQISTVMTLKLRAAVLDVARFTLGQVPKDIADLTHQFEMPPQGVKDIDFVLGYEDSGVWIQGSIESDLNLQSYIKKYPQQWEIVQQCLGLGRSISRHASGFLVANVPVPEMGIPLTTIGGVTCTAFSAPAVEAMGGLKMDFLTVSALQDIERCIQLLQQRASTPPPIEGMYLNGVHVPNCRLIPIPSGGWADIWDLPHDAGVFQDISECRTETVFQLSTPGATKWLKFFAGSKPDGTPALNSIMDLATFTALDRPGPLDAYVLKPGHKRPGLGEQVEKASIERNVLVEYAARAKGMARSEEIPAIFDQLFPETYGICAMQEQVEGLYKEVTGCSGAEAEEFRRNIAKKKKSKIIEAYPKFMAGATEKLGSKETAESVWSFLNTFAQYGFCKCVTGDTIVVRAGANAQKRGAVPEITIKQLYDASISNTPWGKKIRSGLLNILQMSDDGRIRPDRIKAIYNNGPKPVFRVTLENDSSIKATANHKLLTTTGYKTVDQLTTNDSLIVALKKEARRKSGPLQTTRAIGKRYVGQPGGGGVPTGEANPAWLDGRTQMLKNAKQAVWARSGGHCEECKVQAPEKAHALEFAHTKSLEECGGQYSLYHSEHNARMLCNSCHKTFDYAKGERKRRWTQGLPTGVSTVKSIEYVGVEETFDIEMATVAHNFIANGIVSHNSHAVSYMHTAYACAYLKHHYPLEWWTSVLTFADKEEINDTFWHYAGHLIDEPRLTNAHNGFVIKGDRIQAPLSLLDGVGPAAHEELLTGAPYTSMEDYYAKIQAKKLAGTGPGKVRRKTDQIDPKTGKAIYDQVDGIVKGRSALHSGITAKLIITGCMSDMFPPGTTTDEMFEAYQRAEFDHENALRAAMPKPKRPMKTPKPVDEKYRGLTPLTRYQMCKDILPVHSENVLPYLAHFPGVSQSTGGAVFRYQDEQYRLVSANVLKRLNKTEDIPRGGFMVAVAGYVVECRQFEYTREGKRKTACDVKLDLGGLRQGFVKWGDRETGRLDYDFQNLLRGDLAAGSIVIAIINKYKESRPFSLENIVVVQKPLEAKREENE